MTDDDDTPDEPMSDDVLNGPSELDELFDRPIVTDGVTGDTLLIRPSGPKDAKTPGKSHP